MYKGGISDKFGNRYEAKWLVRQLLDVIGGSAKSLKFEGIAADFRGFEFCIEKTNITEWHQTKINSPNGNWTINALKNEGILNAFKSKLISSDENVCKFVSQDPAKDIRSLSEKTRIANSSKEFEETLGEEHKKNILTLNDIWSCNSNQTFEWLKRCEFIIFPEKEIDNLIKIFSEFYFFDCSSSYAILRDYLELNVNISISTNKIKKDISVQKKLVLKSSLLHKETTEKLTLETDAYLSTYIPLSASGELIPRAESQEIIEYIQEKKETTVILLTGVAGAGKSGVIREVIKHLKAEDITHVAIRIDQKLNCSSTTRELGKSVTNVDESLVVTLKEISQHRISVLIIDQIDAVSEISGRDGVVKQTVIKMIDEARVLTSVKIIVSCRTFDFENDPQLRALQENLTVSCINVQLLDWNSSVKPLLQFKNIPIEKFSENQKSLLCLPLNLSIFLEVYEDGNPAFSSRNDLFKKLITQKERSLRTKSNVNWGLMAPLSKLAYWMSTNQKLDAPESILDNYSTSCDLLTSENLIVRSRHTINFFHESFFDYIYARTFIESNSSLVELLLSTEQHLFRRTQARQILETLRQVDLNRYQIELRSIFNNIKIRFHIKVAIAQWIASLIDPNESEQIIILELDNYKFPFPLLVRYSLFNSEIFFDRLFNTEWIFENLNSQVIQRQDIIFWWLRKMAEHRPEKICALLDKWWQGDPNKGKKLLSWLVTIRTPEKNLTELCCKIIRSYPSELFNVDGDSLSPKGMILRLWNGSKPESLLTIIKVYFEAWFISHPAEHPFQRENMREIDVQSMTDIAEKNPRAFIEGSVGAFNKCITIINNTNVCEIIDYTFHFRIHSNPYDNTSLFLNTFRSSLIKIAAEDSAYVIDFLHKIDPDIHEVFTHIWLETIKINGELFFRLFELIVNNKNLLFAGYDGARWLSFANAYQACFPYLDIKYKTIVENRILSHDTFLKSAINLAMLIKTEGEGDKLQTKKRVISKLNSSGYSQWCILESIGENSLSQIATKRLRELRRKFPKEQLPTPNQYKVNFVGSPINQDKTLIMTDDQWLMAISRYKNNDERKRGKSFVSGGALELSGQLQAIAREQPKRFSRLLNFIPDAENKIYINQILAGLSDSKDAEESTLYNAIINAHSRPNYPYGSGIIRIVEKHPKLGKHIEIFNILIFYFSKLSEDKENIIPGEPDKKAEDIHVKFKELATIDDLLNHFRLHHSKSAYDEKFMAADAFENILWAALQYSPNEEWDCIVSKSWKVLEQKICEEKSVKNRSLLIKPLTPLFNYNKNKTSEFVVQLTALAKENANSFRKKLHESIWIQLTLPNKKRKIFNHISMMASKIIFCFFRNTYPFELISPLLSDEGTRLLSFIIRSNIDGKNRLLYRLIHAENDIAKKIGAWHIITMSFYSLEYTPLANMLIKESVINRRLAASIASYSIIESEFSHRAIDMLKKFFNDDDKKVRQQATSAFRNIQFDDFLRFKNLALEYINSSSMEDECSSFLYALKSANCKKDDIVISFTERLLSLVEANHDLLSKKSTDFYSLMELIKTEYINSESDINLRQRLLDILDKMLELEVFNIEEVLKDYE